ncbi:MAG: RHS repeat-associated core domain-containing protein, partial [Candidatus Gracilibacteria bacterium]
PTKVITSPTLTVNYTYNAAGALESVTRGVSTLTDVISNFDYSPMGQVESTVYGNGVTTTNTYDPAEAYRLMNKVTTGIYDDGTGAISGNVQDLTYTYDSIGNITGIVDASITPTNKTLAYGYDDLNRLLTAASTGLSAGDFSENYAYDEVGNMINKSDVGSMVYAGTGSSGVNPHAVSSVDGTAYTYDLNGNLTSNGAHTYTWDKRNRLSSSAGKTFYYDAGGSRYKIKDSSSGTDEYTYYLSPYVELHGGTTTTVGIPTYYLFAGGQRVAALEAGEFTYYTQDHLGGTALATDDSGTVVQLYDYYPYGSELLNTRPTGADVPSEHSFTDKELDGDLGLYYFEARWYDSEIGRFSGQDPMQYVYDPKGKTGVTSLLSDPQSLNFYAYSRNNPLYYIDPSGNLQVHTDGATQEQIDQFDEALTQLQENVANNTEMQDYFNLFGVDINEILTNPDLGPDVYLGGSNPNPSEGKVPGKYDSIFNNVNIYNKAFEGGTGQIMETVIHEVAHWGNDVSDWWGNLNPDLSGFSDYLRQYNVDANFDTSDRMQNDGPYGYITNYILYGQVD